MTELPSTNLKVLHVASECFPLVKTGGLADVVGSLPLALRTLGVASTVLLPAYPSVIRQLPDATKIADLPNLFGGPVSLRSATTDSGLDLLLIDAPHLYERPSGPYVDASNEDWPDNHLRFGALCKVAAQLALSDVRLRGNRRPRFDVLHLHDWQAALTTAYLRFDSRVTSADPALPPTLLTIHNLAFQGIFATDVIRQLGLPSEFGTVEGMEFWGNVSFLKAGVRWASRVSTVSPTYAEEITTPEHGMGFDGLLRARGDAIVGIVNGIDTAVWDPSNDPALDAPFSPFASEDLAGKARNKAALQSLLGLGPDPDALLFAVVSRLSHQKGVDLVLEVIPSLIERGAQFAVLGTGDPGIEAALRRLADRHPESVSVTIGFDEALAHRVHAAADAIVVPSRFEPCGLTQLSGLRYGAVPIVARVGGLADTVIDANDAAIGDGVGTGLAFAPVDTRSLATALHRAVDLHNRPSTWQQLQRRGMTRQVGWDVAASAYFALYSQLLPSAS